MKRNAGSTYCILVLLSGLLFSCNGNTDSGTNKDGPETPASTGIAAPKNINLNIVSAFNHDTGAFTQGLEIYKGKMYESTGDYDNSSLRITDFKTGNVEQKHLMGSPVIFGEGMTIFKDKIYQLTWKNNLVNVYDVKNINKPITTMTWPYEGWGITHDTSDLIISDGSANIYFVNPADFKVKRSIQATDDTGPVVYLNELELINGYIYANVFESDYIVKINPANGHIEGRIYLPGLIKQYAKDFVPDGEAVLNGIAWDSASKKIYITGKHWPKLFEATISE